MFCQLRAKSVRKLLKYSLTDGAERITKTQYTDTRCQLISSLINSNLTNVLRCIFPAVIVGLHIVNLSLFGICFWYTICFIADRTEQSQWLKKLLDIHFRFCWYKICEDLLRNRKVIVENKVTHLYRSLCIILLLKGVMLWDEWQSPLQVVDTSRPNSKRVLDLRWLSSVLAGLAMT